jgi:hypothetical protein
MLDRLRLIDGVSSVTLQSSTKTESGGATSGASSSSAGGCTSGQPAYSVQVTFNPLPSSIQTRSTTSATSPGGSR